MSQNYTDTNAHLIVNDMTEAQFAQLTNVDSNQLYLTEDESANQDLSNLTNAGRILGSGLGMPSNTYIDLTLGTSGLTYTAPANGYFCLNKNKTSQTQYIALINTSMTMGVWSNGNPGASGGMVYTYLPVKRGDIVSVVYSASGTVNYFKFVYAQGSESEAS